MTDTHNLLLQFSARHNTTPVPEQLDFHDRVKQAIAENGKVLLQMDPGVGKTIAAIIATADAAIDRSVPVIYATSTINNRDQVLDDFQKIKEFAISINHPIGNLELINYRSAHDYPSQSRIDNMLQRMRAISAPNSVIHELERIRETVEDDPTVLIDDLLPEPIIATVQGKERIFVERQDIAASLTDPTPVVLRDLRERLHDSLDRPVFIVVTHALLAKHRPLREIVKKGKAIGVIDEVDRIMVMDFISNISVEISEIAFAIATLRDDFGLDVKQAITAFDDLTAAIKAVHNPSSYYAILDRARLPQALCDAVFDRLRDCIEKITAIVEVWEQSAIEVDDYEGEFEQRQFFYQMDEILGAMRLFHEQFLMPYRTESFRLQVDTAITLCVKWDNDGAASLHIVTAYPGRAMKWALAAPIPVILMTAFIGSTVQQFSRDIGFWSDFHPASKEIRLRHYGKIEFIYFFGMPPTMLREKVNPDFLAAVGEEIKKNYRDGERMLVLTPSYHDIEIIAGYLEEIGTPLLVHRRRSNISGLRRQIIERPGILLTVLWEGYNIATNTRPDGRRGVLDKIVLARIPFAAPNPLLEMCIEDIYPGKEAKYQIMNRQLAETTRKVYQGVGRLVRSVHDYGKILIMDGRMPPPPVLLEQNPLLQTKIGLKRLVRAIPQRFLHDARNFKWERHG